eukprot:g33122.t1
MGFGTGIVPDGCGFSLQNRGHNFILQKSHPNCLGPSKFCYHTIIPGMVTREDLGCCDSRETKDLFCTLGVMGGFMQPQGHLQVLCAMADYGLDPQAALDQPRFCLQGVDSALGAASAGAAQLLLEEGMPEETQAQLRSMGHDVHLVTGWQRLVFGRGQDCNPYLGTQYLIIGNGNGNELDFSLLQDSGKVTGRGVSASQRSAVAWNLWMRVYVRFSIGFLKPRIYVTATSDDQDSGYEAFKAVDGSLTSFWAGDHDIGMSCGCWQQLSHQLTHRKPQDGQSILLYLQGNRKVSRIQLHQGGANDPWAVSKIRLHCAASFQANPLPLDISHGMTEITCNADGCGVTSMSIPYQHTCNGASMDKFSMLLVVLVLGQRLFA